LGQMLLQQKWQGWMEMLLSQQLWPRMAFEDHYQICNNSSLEFPQVSVLINYTSDFEMQCKTVLYLIKF
jgi:hypothetical protein